MNQNPDLKSCERAVAGDPVTSILYRSQSTPALKVKYSNIVTPFYYPNSPNIARWSVTCLVDVDENADFMEQIEQLEKKENIKNSQTFKEDTYKDEEGSLRK